MDMHGREWFGGEPSAAIDTDTVDGWREYLVEFQRDMLPVYQSFGFTPGEAFIAWQLQRIYNQLLDVEEAVIGDSDGFS